MQQRQCGSPSFANTTTNGGDGLDRCDDGSSPRLSYSRIGVLRPASFFSISELT
jgi:hypothetical protein